MFGKLVVRDIPAEDLAGIDRHRTVEEYRNVFELAGGLEPSNVKHEALRASNRECRNHDSAAAAHRPGNDFGQRGLRIDAIVLAVAIGRFNDEIIRRGDWRGVVKDRIVVTSEIAGKHDRHAFGFQLDRRGAQNMAGASQDDLHAAIERMLHVEWNGPE